MQTGARVPAQTMQLRESNEKAHVRRSRTHRTLNVVPAQVSREQMWHSDSSHTGYSCVLTGYSCVLTGYSCVLTGYSVRTCTARGRAARRVLQPHIASRPAAHARRGTAGAAGRGACAAGMGPVSPGADVGGVSPVSPGADVGGVSPASPGADVGGVSTASPGADVADRAS